MEKFKGTPGPWEVEYDNECFLSGSEDGDEYYCEFYTITNKVGSDIGRVESKLDANLIASAPDLLEALQELLYELSVKKEVHDGTIIQAEAAIARALGKNYGEE